MYGGTISQVKRTTKRKNSRQEWTLFVLVGNRSYRSLLENLRSHCVIKHSQVCAAVDYLDSGRADPVAAHEVISNLNAEYRPNLDPERIVDPYVAGLFSADGSVGLYRKPNRPGYAMCSSISKSSCVGVLELIRDKYELGFVTKGVLRFTKASTERLLRIVQPHLHGQKLPQVTLALDYLDGRGDQHEVEGKLKKMKKT